MTDFNQKTHDTDVGSHGGKSRQMMEVFENQEFGSIRVLQEAGKTFFCASDVAKALGYVNPYAAVKRHCRTARSVRVNIRRKKRSLRKRMVSTMPVFRVEKNSNYTTMCNYHLRDQGLSLKGKGLLSMLLSLPDTWNYSVRGLSSITPDGVDGVLTALKELERLGYLERNQQRESNGRMGRAEYVIYEMPRKKPCSELPCTEKPYTVNPDTDTPVTENPAQLSTNRTSTETINKREKKDIQHRYFEP